MVNVLDTRRVAGSGNHQRVDQARAEREPLLAEIVQRARAVGVGAEFLVWTGDPGEAILSAVESEQAHLVVVGSHGRDRAGRFLLGSVSDHLVRNADCPVPGRAPGQHASHRNGTALRDRVGRRPVAFVSAASAAGTGPHPRGTPAPRQ